MNIDERLASIETDIGDIITDLFNLVMSEDIHDICTQKRCGELQSALNDLLSARIKIR